MFESEVSRDGSTNSSRVDDVRRVSGGGLASDARASRGGTRISYRDQIDVCLETCTGSRGDSATASRVLSKHLPAFFKKRKSERRRKEDQEL